jgi:hypothetical protein
MEKCVWMAGGYGRRVKAISPPSELDKSTKMWYYAVLNKNAEPGVSTMMTPDEILDLLFDSHPWQRDELRKRLYDRRDITSDGCWVYRENLSGRGYPRIDFTMDGQRYRIRANRLSYRLHKRYTPPEAIILHTCDNILCWNPEHLFMGDAKANQQDRIGKGRPGPGKLTTAQADEIKRRFAAGETRWELARAFGVHYTTVRDIIRKRYHW